jgi:urease accessory protein
MSVVAVAGMASLTFESRRGATVMSHARVEAPLKVVRPFTIADGRLVVPLITLGPGLCGGDACTIDVHAGAGARVVITTTAATRVLGMADLDSAVQRVRLVAAAGAQIEYYPGLTIPFPDSAFDQRIEVIAAPDTRVGVLETWALGRAARGEYLRFRRLRARTTLHVDGALAYADAMLLNPQELDLAGAGVLDRRRYIATGFWHGTDLAPSAGHSGMTTTDQTIAAFGQSAPGLVFLRALGNDGIALDRTINDARARVAEAWRLPPLKLERFRC